MTPWAVGRIVSEMPSRMLSVANVAISDGILRPRMRAALTNPSPSPAREDHRDPCDDLERRGVGADQERADHDAEADHRPHRQVEVADQERVRLGDGGQRERHGQQQDRGDVGLVDEAVEPVLGVREQRHDQQALQGHRHPQPDLDDLAPLVLVASVAGDLAGELSCSVDSGGLDLDGHATSSGVASRRWRFGHRDTERRSCRFRHAGAANDGLDDAGLVQFVPGDLLDDGAPRHHEHPITQP